LGREFAEVESISFDHAIMEKTDGALVIPLDVGWDDLGSYRSLLDASERDAAGNHVSGDVSVVDVTGSLVRATSRRVVVAGMDDVVVVETPEAVLVLSIDRAQDVRDLHTRKPAT
jgi:mannose-1-phosphate guanylyltransferase